MTTHIMLDIETLGVRPGFAVASVALVRFSDYASTAVALDTAEQNRLGLQNDPATCEWWSGQSDAAKQAAFGSPLPLETGLRHIADWLAWAAGDPLIWCHGASFDAPLLQEVYRVAGMPCPWSFRNVRDTRTLYDLAGIDLREYGHGVDHVALDDAIAQTKAANAALAVLARAHAPQAA
jgi:hypothetical protein